MTSFLDIILNPRFAQSVSLVTIGVSAIVFGIVGIPTFFEKQDVAYGHSLIEWQISACVVGFILLIASAIAALVKSPGERLEPQVNDAINRINSTQDRLYEHAQTTRVIANQLHQTTQDVTNIKNVISNGDSK